MLVKTFSDVFKLFSEYHATKTMNRLILTNPIVMVSPITDFHNRSLVKTVYDVLKKNSRNCATETMNRLALTNSILIFKTIMYFNNHWNSLTNIDTMSMLS